MFQRYFANLGVVKRSNEQHAEFAFTSLTKDQRTFESWKTDSNDCPPFPHWGTAFAGDASNPVKQSHTDLLPSNWTVFR
jgi:hypothetical protein